MCESGSGEKKGRSVWPSLEFQGRTRESDSQVFTTFTGSKPHPTVASKLAAFLIDEIQKARLGAAVQFYLVLNEDQYFAGTITLDLFDGGSVDLDVVNMIPMTSGVVRPRPARIASDRLEYFYVLGPALWRDRLRTSRVI
jgi:hypothetical protein